MIKPVSGYPDGETQAACSVLRERCGREIDTRLADEALPVRAEHEAQRSGNHSRDDRPTV